MTACQQLILQGEELYLQTTTRKENDGEGVIVETTPFRLFAGAMHYFRIPPAYWEDRIVKCRQMGCNTLETYVAWNVHQPNEPGQDHGKDDSWMFEGWADLVQFVQLVQKHGLYLIVRFSPYICAEWDNGGIPSWLLRDRNVRLRTRHPVFWKAVKEYYRVMVHKLKPFFSTNGGHILAGQLENEYGCTNNDAAYLQQHYHFLRVDLGVDIPLFNGIWAEERFLKAGKCEGTIVALNFNEGAKEKFAWLQATSNPDKVPRICTEFWVGWFSAWGGHRYKPKEPPEVIASRLDELLEAKGHAILYLFHGGTNFGMRNGSNIRSDYCQFTITSYDYEAPLNEAGQTTPYYEAIQKVARKHGFLPPHDTLAVKPVPPPIAYPSIQVIEHALLLSQLKTPHFQRKMIQCCHPLSMEECHQDFGYLLYRTRIPGPTPPGDNYDKLSINELRDRAHVFIDGIYLETLERTTGRCVAQTQQGFQVPSKGCRLDILVENQGRCNFPPFTQDFKGVTETVFLGDCFVLSNWEHYPIDFSKDQMNDLAWAHLPTGSSAQEDNDIHKPQIQSKQPGFFRAQWDLPSAGKPKDTYIHLPEWQKGVVLVNGISIGRYWNNGPQLSLYCPAPLLLHGKNNIIIFEEERPGKSIEFVNHLIMEN